MPCNIRAALIGPIVNVKDKFPIPEVLHGVFILCFAFGSNFKWKQISRGVPLALRLTFSSFLIVPMIKLVVSRYFKVRTTLASPAKVLGNGSGCKCWVYGGGGWVSCVCGGCVSKVGKGLCESMDEKSVPRSDVSGSSSSSWIRVACHAGTRSTADDDPRDSASLSKLSFEKPAARSSRLTEIPLPPSLDELLDPFLELDACEDVSGLSFRYF